MRGAGRRDRAGQRARVVGDRRQPDHVAPRHHAPRRRVRAARRARGRRRDRGRHRAAGHARAPRRRAARARGRHVVHRPVPSGHQRATHRRGRAAGRRSPHAGRRAPGPRRATRPARAIPIRWRATCSASPRSRQPGIDVADPPRVKGWVHERVLPDGRWRVAPAPLVAQLREWDTSRQLGHSSRSPAGRRGG